MSKYDYLFVISFFYLGWFGSVFLAQTSYIWLSFIFPLMLIGFLFFRQQLNIKLFSSAAAIAFGGVLFDSFLADFQFILIEGQTSWLIPIWLVSIWLLFSFSMIKMGDVFRLPVWFATLLGFILGPLSYKSGEIFKVLTFLTPWTFFVYAVFWAALFPLMLSLSKRFS